MRRGAGDVREGFLVAAVAGAREGRVVGAGGGVQVGHGVGVDGGPAGVDFVVAAGGGALLGGGWGRHCWRMRAGFFLGLGDDERGRG